MTVVTMSRKELTCLRVLIDLTQSAVPADSDLVHEPILRSFMSHEMCGCHATTIFFEVLG
jgi:hypothetical protein